MLNFDEHLAADAQASCGNAHDAVARSDVHGTSQDTSQGTSEGPPVAAMSAHLPAGLLQAVLNQVDYGLEWSMPKPTA